jgi:hypothetical protein
VGYLSLALRVGLAFVFVAALIGKLSGRGAVIAFKGMLADIDVPPRLIGPAGIGILAAEFTVVALIPWERTGLVGSLIAVVLLALFSGTLARAVRRGSRARCRCFGSRSRRLGGIHIVRNVLLVIVAMVGAMATSLAGGQALHPIGVILSVALAAPGALIIVLWEDLAVVLRGLTRGELVGSGRSWR